jgi:hypothetical protein
MRAREAAAEEKSGKGDKTGKGAASEGSSASTDSSSKKALSKKDNKPLISKDEMTALVRLINMDIFEKNKRKRLLAHDKKGTKLTEEEKRAEEQEKADVRYMDFSGFKELITQVAILGFSRGEKDLSNKPPVHAVEELIDYMRDNWKS